MGGAGSARAASQSLTFSTQESTTPSDMLGFNQFDTSLGTLNSIDITLLNSTTGLGSEVSLTGGEGSGNAGFTADLNIIGPGGTLESGSANASASCNSFNSDRACDSGLVAPSQTTPTPNPVDITNASLFAPFEGTGTVDISAAVENFATTDSTCLVPSCTFSNDLSWNGTIDVAYNYTPSGSGTSVPEPGSLVLLGSGLIGLAGLRRRSASVSNG